MADLMEKHPPSPKDYRKLGPVYIKKWLLFMILASLCILVIAIFGLPTALFSAPSRKPPAYRYNDTRLLTHSGLVRILDQHGTVRYEGEMNDGSCTGLGAVFDSAGALVYEGPLVENCYDGPDAKVYRDGIAVYVGEMAQNVYEGQGRRTDPKSGVVSDGQFSRGVLEGLGKQHAADGTLLRQGVFSNDLLEGEGIEYGKGGMLLREGSFVSGLLHGDGKEYTPSGTLLYEGEFERGVYHGQGKLYNASTQALCFTGEFTKGKPTGAGSIYHPSGQKLFEGSVWQGRPRADSFLGLSLAEVEIAFTEHWDLYTYGEFTAFVYPTFHLLFITKSPVLLSSPAASSAQSEQDKQDILNALAGNSQAKTKTATAQQSLRTDAAAAAEPAPSDDALAPDSNKSDIIICEVICVGDTLAGAAQPTTKSVSVEHAPDWRTWFCDYERQQVLQGVTVRKTGQFIYRFAPWGKAQAASVREYWAQDGDMQTKTIVKEGKDGEIWYQSAVREEKT